jgi:hypothetical protein
MEAPSTRSNFKGVIPFKVKFDFDIPLFEGHIDDDALEKWLSLLEGYFSIQNYSNGEKSSSFSLRPFPM